MRRASGRDAHEGSAGLEQVGPSRDQPLGLCDNEMAGALYDLNNAGFYIVRWRHANHGRRDLGGDLDLGRRHDADIAAATAISPRSISTR